MKFCNKVLKILPLFLVVLFAGSVNATYIESGTTHYNQAWGDGHLKGSIDWAVYDVSNYETDFEFSAPGSGSENDYIYVYIINNADDSYDSISSFAILGLDETNVSGQTHEDYGGGLYEPDSEYLDETDGAVWEWVSEDSYIVQNGSSWMLVLRSEYGPIERDYVLKGSSDPLQGPGVPEPATVALLGAGGAFLLRRSKRKKSQLM
jgi:hypothetical protein